MEEGRKVWGILAGCLLITAGLWSLVVLAAHAAPKPKDTVSPTIALAAPEDQATVGRSTLAVWGSVIDNVGVASATLTVNGSSSVDLKPLLDTTGKFLTTISLSVGANILNLRAADKARNVSEVNVTVYYENTPKLLEIQTPCEGDFVDARRVDVAGRGDLGIIEMVVAGFWPVFLESGRFHIDNYPLEPGVNTIEVAGRDADGNVCFDSVTIFCTSQQDPIRLKTDIPGGTAPLTVTFSLDQNTSEPIISYEIDWEGTGEFIPCPAGVDGLSHTYATERVYHPTTRVTTVRGLIFSDYTDLPVYDPVTLSGVFPAVDPAGLAIDKNSRLLVVERAAGRVSIYSEEGEKLTFFGSPGSDPGQFSQPAGIALDEAGNVYVADTGNHRIQKFSPSFKLLEVWGDPGYLKSQLNGPSGITLDPSGNVYVSDTGNRRIQKFTNDGYFIKDWGTDRLTQPWGIIYLGGERVLVADRAAGLIFKYSASGSFYEWENAPLFFMSPCGISRDPLSQYLIVADSGNNGVEILTKEGDFVREIKEIPGDESGLSRPMAAVLGTSPVENDLFIADTGHNRIVKVAYSAIGGGNLVQVWNGMKQQLFSGNIEGALTYFAPQSREKYREIFNMIESELELVKQDLSSADIIPLEIGDYEAKYAIIREDEGRQVLFEIKFVKNRVGNWEILEW